MSRYAENDTYAKAGDWLIGTARRNPEALLLFAAGCALLMRSGAGSSARGASRSYASEPSSSHYGDEARQAFASNRGPSSACQGFSGAVESATSYASEIKDRISDTASSYAESMSEFAEDARRTVSERSEGLRRQAQSTLESGMNRVLRDQPLAVAVLGLAAGAAVAAAFRSTEIENRALGGAREALTDAASRAGDKVMGAAGKVGERLKAVAEERGLTSEGLKELASEVAGTFSDAVSGKADPHASASMVPQSPASGGASGRASGTSPSQWDNRGTTGSIEPGGRGSR